MRAIRPVAISGSRLSLAAEALGALVVFLARVFLPEGRPNR
jgi:hypothetical protein